MKRMTQPLLVAVSLAALVIAAAPQEARAALDLPARPKAVLNQTLVPGEDVSVIVRDVATGESLVEVNPSIVRQPASTMKVVTTLAALDTLSPAYTWKTRALTDGAIDKGVLKGNLYLQGGGDPLMTIERWWRFVADLKQQGVRTISGDIVIDQSYFAPLNEDRGDFDGKGWRTYNVLPDALLVNLQSSEFVIRPSAKGLDVEVDVDPLPANLVIEDRARVTAGRCRSHGRGIGITTPKAEPNKVIVTGQMSASCAPIVVRRVIMEPAEYAYGTFVSLYRGMGGQFDGRMRKGTTPAGAKLLLRQESLTLAEIVRVTNKFSSNAMARTLALTLGVERFGTPGTQANGEAAIHEWLAGKGLDTPSLVIGNGSGLSREARIAPDTMARVLQAAWKGRYAPEFLSSLPLGGLDGTLRKRFDDVSDPSRIRMKTGSLDGVSALAGYVTGQSGRTYAVVIMVNHRGVQNGPGEQISSAVVRWVLGQ